MRLQIFFSLIILFITLTSCDKDIEDIIDISTFDQVSENDMYNSLNPSNEFDYFEIRYSDCGELDFETIYERGTKCIGFLDSTQCHEQINSLKPESNGFHLECLPSCCGYYIVSQINQTNYAYGNSSELISFLGDIDSKSDALLLAFSHGYSFEYDFKDRAAIKEINNGYQIIALKMVSDCLPVQVDKFLLEVDVNGNFLILEQDVFSKSDGLCI